MWHLTGLVASSSLPNLRSPSPSAPLATVHRSARITLRTTPAQRHRCLALLHAGGDVWAWLVDRARTRHHHGLAPASGYTALCRDLARHQDGFAPLGSVGARSVLRHYATAWFEAAKRRKQGQRARFPTRKRRYVPVRFYHGTFELDGRRLRLPVARGHPPLWVRLARPLPYPTGGSGRSRCCWTPAGWSSTSPPPSPSPSPSPSRSQPRSRPRSPVEDW